ncbi:MULTISPECIES: cupin domain-containing protein [Myxococcaceae]|uniref:cupin domain-containing protein n=1 Tax=Myxococcaceae TaxID=31 RepID=UPI00188FD172|nr:MULTISPECIES: cupin domain-containing protein [Myxococcaceae]MBF5041938.1 cupin domain-containing protein [Simulacricoccus sp. 17bor-14]
MIRTLRSTLLTGALCLPAALVFAQATPTSHEGHAAAKHMGAGQDVVVTANDLKWGDGPPSLPPGAKVAVLEGDPGKPGPFAMRIKFPANYRIGPHHHSQDERLTVLSGNASIGMGAKFDASKMTALSAGGYFSMPKGHKHFLTTSEETVLQLNSNGPFDIVYVDKADDPRTGKATAKKAQ